MDAPVYQFLRQLPEGAIVEFPLPTYGGEVRLDSDYMFWSTRHWRKLVNGYSGYFPPWYDTTIDRLRSLPSVDALSLLRDNHVRFILVHTAYLEPADGDLLVRLVASPDLRALGSYADWAGATAVFELIQ